MADLGVALDAAGIAGLVGGKKGAKGTGGQSVQAGFITALLAQMGKADKAQTADLPEGGLPPVGQTEAWRDSAGALSVLGKDDKTARGTGEAAATDGNELGAAVLPTDSPMPPQAAVGGAMTSTAETTDVLPPPPRRDPASAVRSPLMGRQQADSPAILADGHGKNAPGLSGLPQGAPPPTGDVATVTSSAGEVLAAPSPPPAKTDAADAMPPRGFDHILRQVDARLNASVEAPVRSAAFAQELGDKVVWLASRNGQVAELSLNPTQLGSVEVRLTLSGGEAGAQFFAASPMAREAIESALPRLRELMAQAGLTLGEAQVRDQAFSQGHRGPEPGAGGGGSLGEDPLQVVRGAMTARGTGLGLVDLYA